ncbi:anaerobic glycerol-3-phosphate dehydrogenase subunit C [Naegleria gruberi]|uniref:Anaerobic glycerol-3-phosphate dehydrogenase subunit C n=1 Tax=Naegleria gruberi TaxID=5762 RepID=D2V6M8_NAEGR|nr:anaerobic glycerol-3-phosphate dehydrogenase subunit C [Naegleria gruberi]EFC47468.1 anaerobic glycerol-3-phosphate dehydrogenase subunit C [Naegleria gruberi]|eukprot:XP_002680212.1 anaerobic glycerol-3-phosphate dehydrogenase subunit C [Naegleria gruberi strain NEG-M]
MIKKVVSLNKTTHQINKIVGNAVARGFHVSQFRREEEHVASNTSSNAGEAKRVPRKKRFATLAVEEEINSSTSTSTSTPSVQREAQRFEAFRYSIPWKDAEYYNEEKLENEMRRIFEICHGCRRCFNLCESFPSLFDMIDKVEVLEQVPSSEFKKISDKCTMCDLCYNTKCPYVPPHEFNIDFPHLMLRYRAVEQKKKNESHTTQNPPIQLRETTGFLTKDSPNKEFEAPVHEGVDRKLTLEKESELSQQLLTKMDRNGFLLTRLPQSISYFLMNNSIIRTILDKLNLVHKKAYLPPFTFGTLMGKLNSTTPKNQSSNTNQEKVIIYTTCLGNYNKPELVEYSKYILEKNGVEVAIDYNMCCGMPYFEQGDLAAVSKSAEKVSDFLVNKYISKGFKVVTVVPSCSLMLKSEWANVLPENENVQSVKRNTMDITEYLVYLAKKNGGKLPTHDQIKEIPYSITLHHACHARAQNMGNKGLDVLKFIPNAKVSVIQRCSGHGGSFGTKKAHFDTAVKFGMPVAKKILQDASKSKTTHVMSSECPLAQEHLAQVTEMSKEEKQGTVSTISSNGNDHNIQSKHPIEILYEAYQK